VSEQTAVSSSPVISSLVIKDLISKAKAKAETFFKAKAKAKICITKAKNKTFK